MAKQKGIIKLKGTIGDVSFYKSRDGYLAREKGGVDGARIASDPVFQRTRENGLEFGRAGKASKMLRRAFRPVMLNSADPRVSSRLTTYMMKALKEDGVNVRGARTIQDGKPGLLEGFNFNSRAPLAATLFAPMTATFDRVTGDATINLPAFIPQNTISAPAGTTHFKVVASVAAIDFESEQFSVDSAAGTIDAWDSGNHAIISLTPSIAANSSLPVFLVVGIEFYQEVNGTTYPLKNGSYNALAIVKVDA